MPPDWGDILLYDAVAPSPPYALSARSRAARRSRSSPNGRIRHEDAERRCSGYDRDSGTKSLCQCNTFINGHVR